MQNNLDNLLTIISIAGTVGSTSALLVDFGRRFIRSKAAEYAAQSHFARIASAVEVLQETLEGHVKTAGQQHMDLCQRVARLEGPCDR